MISLFAWQLKAEKLPSNILHRLMGDCSWKQFQLRSCKVFRLHSSSLRLSYQLILTEKFRIKTTYIRLFTMWSLITRSSQTLTQTYPFVYQIHRSVVVNPVRITNVIIHRSKLKQWTFSDENSVVKRCSSSIHTMIEVTFENSN